MPSDTFGQRWKIEIIDKKHKLPRSFVTLAWLGGKLGGMRISFQGLTLSAFGSRTQITAPLPRASRK
jgi:hypothetical protein